MCPKIPKGKITISPTSTVVCMEDWEVTIYPESISIDIPNIGMVDLNTLIENYVAEEKIFK